MTLQQAIEKAYSLQHLVGTKLREGGLMVEAVIPAPINESLSTTFIFAVMDAIVEGRTPVPYYSIATTLRAIDFEVVILYEGTLHKNWIQRSGDILYERFDESSQLA